MIREMKTFLAIVRCGSFAAAGNQIGLTQSAVSAQIKNLEDALGMHLFDRTGRSAHLNAAGLRAVPLAEQILETYALMGQPETLNEYRGELRIGAIATVQTGLLPPVLLRLLREAPGVAPKLVPGVSLNLLSQVDAGDIDLAVMIRPPFALPKELHAELIQKEPFMLIAPLSVEGDDPLRLLVEHPLVRYDRNSFGGRQVSQFLRKHHLDVRPGLELDELDAIVKMVESGLGVALVPKAGLWLERTPTVRIISLGSATFYRELMLVSRHSAQRLPLHQLFRRCLRETLEERSSVS
ncbi:MULTISPECIES: LysR family transcriptional regulator [Pseudomonadaceae]|uniref:LysR family transcriptional regulator n=1 Tax=Pseudomonadaceae TaxID=135621 RepID=UPI0015E3B554|nr:MULTISPECIES: LysR family transcriptional regulator [Pseudomonadaceae]MBA1279437.1 LysR family transcriptional regulator [Stutzerimonas stutzeri]MBC8648477.1 LysR family transcriptional regulator [Pseudomonas sp. MT4]QXY90417.1 LysR family transcriptional regulator [Pseudomonas sp. MTM4]